MTNSYDKRIHGSDIDVKTDSSPMSRASGQSNAAQKADAELERLRDAVDAQKSQPPERSLSAMQVIVDYRIEQGTVKHTVRGEDHIFDLEVPFSDHWERKPVNAFALRDNFLRAKGWNGAFDFLRVSGPFSTERERITLKEFGRWQEFTRLVLVKEEREALSSALRNGNRSGDPAEVLKALTGLYPSAFFDGVGVREAASTWEPKHLTPEQATLIKQSEIKYEQRRVERLKALCSWFRRPPEKACSIRWVPKGPQEWKEALKLLNAGRALLDADARPGLEFSLPRKALRPVLVIEAQCSLHAIAASIYADYWDGVEYKKCPECGNVFPLGAGKKVGRWQEKEHCSDKCKQAGVNRNRPKNRVKKASKPRAARKPGKV